MINPNFEPKSIKASDLNKNINKNDSVEIIADLRPGRANQARMIVVRDEDKGEDLYDLTEVIDIEDLVTNSEDLN